LVEPAELLKQVAANAGQKMIPAKRRLGGQLVHQLKTGCWTGCHRDCHRTVERYDRGGCDFGELGIERHNARPVRLLGSPCPGVTGRDFGLQQIGPWSAAQLSGAFYRGQTSADQEMIPASAVLVQEQDRLSRWAYPRFGARGLNLHQRDQT